MNLLPKVFDMVPEKECNRWDKTSDEIIEEDE